MANQRFTLVKLGGSAADLARLRFQEWAETRVTGNPKLFTSEQWPKSVRERADDFANRIRIHAFQPPIMYFSEWGDPWSAGNLCDLLFGVPEGNQLIAIDANLYSLYGYSLPDNEKLIDSLRSKGTQQFCEQDRFIARIIEAIEAWDGFETRSYLIALRSVIGPSVLDEEMAAALKTIPEWLA